MEIVRFILLVGVLAVCATAQAEVTFEIIAEGGATDISDDGTVVVGNTNGAYETFRWTQEDGMVLLGLATVPVLGVGAGTPDVSDDGVHASATILGRDSTYATVGRWTLDEGWLELMPPTLPDGGLIDNAYGSAWGLSGDGTTVVGLYWRPGHGGPVGDGLAHACRWTVDGGMVDLGSAGGNSRANAANYDGSVIVGWAESDVGGWQPTVWVDEEMTILQETDAMAILNTVNYDGTIVGGQAYDDSLSISVATLWRWNGSSWDEDRLGTLPNTFPHYGSVICNDMTPDGSTIVGYNAYDWTQSTGFVWTEETGMYDIEDYLNDNGVTVPTSFRIQTLTGVSADATTMVGIGMDTMPPWANRWFIIRTTATGVADDPDAPGEAEVASRMRAYPNPMRGATTLSLNLPERARVDLEVYDVSGRLVRRLVAGTVDAGKHEVHWDGKDSSGADVASGIYLCRLATDQHEETTKITVLR
jgi:uncharacterized membrane protein